MEDRILGSSSSASGMPSRASFGHVNESLWYVPDPNVAVSDLHVRIERCTEEAAAGCQDHLVRLELPPGINYHEFRALANLKLSGRRLVVAYGLNACGLFDRARVVSIASSTE